MVNLIEYCYRYDDPQCEEVVIFCRKYKVIKHTPLGFWIRWGGRANGKRWISKNGKTSYAFLTRDKAWESFKHRKIRQYEIYDARKRRVGDTIDLAASVHNPPMDRLSLFQCDGKARRNFLPVDKPDNTK